jgi:hypothetical protein
VTGLVVNRRLGVSRRLVKRWRAVVHQVRRDGPAGKAFGPSSDVLASLVGFAAFVHMVEPEKGAAMLATARELAALHGWSPPRRPEPAPAPAAAPPPAPEPAPPDGEERPKWYEFWKWFGSPKG